MLRTGHLLALWGYSRALVLLPGCHEAVGCREDPLWADEGPSTDVCHAHICVLLDADDPWPGAWLGICAPDNACCAAIGSHGPEPAGPVTKTHHCPALWLLLLVLKVSLFLPHRAVHRQQDQRALCGVCPSAPVSILVHR